MRRVLLALIAAAVALAWIGPSAGAAQPPRLAAIVISAYDPPLYEDATDHTAPERGPPVAMSGHFARWRVKSWHVHRSTRLSSESAVRIASPLGIGSSRDATQVGRSRRFDGGTRPGKTT
jgi:hypothetical protein